MMNGPGLKFDCARLRNMTLLIEYMLGILCAKTVIFIVLAKYSELMFTLT